VRGYANSNKTISQIGKELGVGYVLTGSVRWDKSVPGKSRVRVSPALLRTSDGSQVWSEPYEDEVSGIFQIQSKVAQRVADAMKIQLNRGEQQTLSERPTDNVEAYDYYLRGQAASDAGRNGSDFLRSVALFQKAVQLDPKFANAWRGLADAHLDTYWFRADPTEKRLTLAKAAIDKLVALEPDAAGTHDALGNYYYHGKLDYENAIKEFGTALKLSPSDASASQLRGRVERRQGKWSDATADMRRAFALDPRNPTFLSDLAETLTMVREYDEAISVSRQLIAVTPDKFSGYALLANAQLLATGSSGPPLATLRDAVQKVSGDDLGLNLFAYANPIFLDRTLSDIAKRSAIPENDGDRLNYYWGRQSLAFYQKDEAAMKMSADSMLAILPRVLTGSFSDADAHKVAAFAYATRGDREHALSEVRKALDMMPLSRDALRGSDNTLALGQVATLVGDKDVAISALRQSLAMPSIISVAVLRTDPWFDSLRSDTRFQQLLAGH
jgi:tetratricopeptide (TPR) repeat protein